MRTFDLISPKVNAEGVPANNSFERATGLRPVAAQLMIRYTKGGNI